MFDEQRAAAPVKKKGGSTRPAKKPTKKR